VLAAQKDMNVSTWRMLQDRGVTEASMLQLDFTFDAPGQAEADRLVRFLQRETDYQAETARVDRGGLRRRGWIAKGQTGATTISLDILDDWVQWMVTAGALHGACRFDGWGTQLGQ
jgi:hypothetical protein